LDLLRHSRRATAAEPANAAAGRGFSVRTASPAAGPATAMRRTMEPSMRQPKNF
jgi:hypothetical protein